MQLVSSIALLVGAAPFQREPGRERVRMLNHVARLAHEVGNAMLLPQVPGEARRVRSCLLGGYLFCSGSIIGSGRLTKRYLGLFRVCSGRIA